MKTIKRTTIKIRRREVIAVVGSESETAKTVHTCPFCKFTFSSQTGAALEAKAKAELPEATEIILSEAKF